MVALRSLEAEEAMAAQHLDFVAARPLRSKHDQRILARAGDKLRAAQHALAQARKAKP